MADEEDTKELFEGNLDLVHRDLSGGRFLDLNLEGRDFSKAHLEKANFSGANLSGSKLIGAKTRGMVASGADLSHINAEQTVIFGVDFTRANLRDAVFRRAHFTKANLTGADIRGADFSAATFNEGTTFEDCISDSSTNFDGAQIFRPLARQEVFRFYRVDRGILIRLTDSETEESTDVQVGRNIRSLQPNTKKIIAQIDQVVERLEELKPMATTEARQHGGLGHNNPPEATPISISDYDTLVLALRVVRQEIETEELDTKKVEDAKDQVASSAKAIASWVARKADAGAEEFSKQIGKSLGDARVLLASWLMISGQLQALVDALAKLLS